MFAQMLASFLPEGVTVELLGEQAKKAAHLFEQTCNDIAEIKANQKIILELLQGKDNATGSNTTIDTITTERITIGNNGTDHDNN
jgi:hypothetical protein